MPNNESEMFDFEQGTSVPTQENPVLYRNYSNNYGRDAAEADIDAELEEIEELLREDEPEQEPIPAWNPDYEQAKRQPITAYNTDREADRFSRELEEDEDDGSDAGHRPVGIDGQAILAALLGATALALIIRCVLILRGAL